VYSVHDLLSLFPPERRRLAIIIGNFVQPELPYFDVCLSDTPYQHSSPLVAPPTALFWVVFLMFQHEFAMRPVAQPTTALWSHHPVNVQLYFKVDHVMNIGRNNFHPPPNVKPSVVCIMLLDPRPPVRFEELDGLHALDLAVGTEQCTRPIRSRMLPRYLKGTG
jgi:18S rRNA (adenine1779-N6/adenine1780-N6)-dimethyltransferase